MTSWMLYIYIYIYNKNFLTWMQNEGPLLVVSMRWLSYNPVSGSDGSLLDVTLCPECTTDYTLFVSGLDFRLGIIYGFFTLKRRRKIQGWTKNIGGLNLLIVRTQRVEVSEWWTNFVTSFRFWFKVVYLSGKGR